MRASSKIFLETHNLLFILSKNNNWQNFLFEKKILTKNRPTLHFVKNLKFHNCIKNSFQELKFCTLISAS